MATVQIVAKFGTTITKGTMDPEGVGLLTYLLTYLLTMCLYGKPRLCINIHHCAPPHTVNINIHVYGWSRPDGSARNSCNGWPLYVRTLS